MNLNDAAKKASGASELTAGKTKLSTAEVIKKFPKGLTVSAVDIFGTGADEYGVLNAAEDDSIYFFAGQALTGLIRNWVDMCGTIEEVNKQLKTEPVKILLRQTKTKKGKDFTSFEVI